MLHATCYLVHVTCFLVHVTCYKLHVTSYMLHVTCLDDVKTFSRQITVFSKFIFSSKRLYFFYLFHLPSLIAFFVLLFGECVRSCACGIFMNVTSYIELAILLDVVYKKIISSMFVFWSSKMSLFGFQADESFTDLPKLLG